MFHQALTSSAIFHGAHPEEVSAFVNRHIGGHRLQLLSGEQHTANLSFREFAGFGLSRVSYGNHVRVQSPSLDDLYHLQVVTRGECRWRQGDARIQMRQGEAMMINPTEAIDLEYSADCEKVIIKVPEAVLRSSRVIANGRVPEQGIRFARSVVNLRQHPSLTNILLAVFSELEELEEEVSLISCSYREIILKKILKVFPGNCGELDCAAVCVPALARTVRYIDQNLRADIDLEALSVISNMSVRSLYNAFAKAFSTTPKCYIKQAKLRKLREDLLGGRCRNVTEVALDYGFSHLGRFSSDYRKLFGELPSETLRLAG